jgi:hypothetical protein
MDVVTVLSTVTTVAVAVGTATYWLGVRLTGVEKDIEALKREVEGLRDELGRLRRDVENGFNRLTNTTVGVGEIMVRYLGVKGVLNPREVDFLRATLRSLASTVTNPLTPEERRRLLELVDKDDLTIEEAEELYRLARKVFDEYIDKTPDAVAALFYAIIKRVEAYEKHGGQA